MDKICLLSKIIIIVLVLLLFWKISQSYTSSFTATSLEPFQNDSTSVIKSVNYLKLNETYLEPEGTNLELLYSTYSGQDLGDVWKDQTLDQCIDTCNQLDNCVGFSRDLVNDDAPANCFPRTKIGTCHSNRKEIGRAHV